MYSINYTHQFKKDMRKCAKRGLDIEEIKTAIKILSEIGALPAEYKPHLLKGDRKGQWECHIEPNWLMTSPDRGRVRDINGQTPRREQVFLRGVWRFS